MPDALRSRAQKVRSVWAIMVADTKRSGWRKWRGSQAWGDLYRFFLPVCLPLDFYFFTLPRRLSIRLFLIHFHAIE